MVSRSPVFLSEFGRVSGSNLFGAGTCPEFDTKNGGIYNKINGMHRIVCWRETIILA